MTAFAGGYGGASYSGGQCTFTPQDGPPPNAPTSYGSYNGGYGGGFDQERGVTQCGGAITTTFPYTPAAGQTVSSDPPPTSVIVTETCMMNVGVGGSSYYTPPTVTGDYNAGLGGGQVTVQTSTSTSGTAPYYSTSGSAYGTYVRYSVVSGASPLTLPPCTPTANATVTAPDDDDGNGTSNVEVSYSAAVSPVTIQLTGTTPDPNGDGGLNILVGQHCGASITGMPAGCTVTYQWSVSGTTFQTWSSDTPANGNNPYNPDASYEVDGPGPLTNSTAGWYWNDLHQTNEIVSCTATVTPPAGQGSPFTVTAMKTVTVWMPDWTGTGTGGYVKVNLYQNTGNYEIFAGPTNPMVLAGQLGGMNFNATV